MRICTHCGTPARDPNAKFCGRDGQPFIDAPNAIPTAKPNGGSPLAASVAMALFPHHFVRHLQPDNGLYPPCLPNLRVNPVQFDYDLPIITFWYLREQGLIHFVQPVPPRPHPTVGVEANAAKNLYIPGLEFDFLEIIKACAPGTSVQVVFRLFLGKAIYYPEKNLRNRVNEWLAQLGYGEADTTPEPFIQFGDDGERRLLKFFPDCQRIMAEEPHVQKIHRRWINFLTTEPDLYHALFQDVVRAGDDACRSNSRSRWSSYCKANEDYDARAKGQT